jgi:cytochrome c-type biogenesis protein CcmE
MAEVSWEKPREGVNVAAPKRLKFAIAGALMLGAVAFLMLSGTLSGGRFFTTVNDVLARPELVGKTVKLSGAVIGDTIKFNADSKTISFTIANVPDNATELQNDGGLAKVLHDAVHNPNAKHVGVVIQNQAMPDLLKDEAQAIVTGKLGSDGVFRADELLLKCPSKYASDVPQQVTSN